MAQRGRYATKKKPLIKPHIMLGAVCTALTAFVIAILYTFNPHDQSWFYYTSEQTAATNLGGSLGAHIAAALLYAFGLACYLVPLLLLAIASIAWTQKPVIQELDRLLAGLILLPVVSAICFVYRIGMVDYMLPGGRAGQLLHGHLSVYFDATVVVGLLWLIVFTSLIVISRLSFVVIFQTIFGALSHLVVNWRAWVIPIVRTTKTIGQALAVPLKWLYRSIRKLLTAVDIEEGQESVFAFEQGQSEQTEFESEEFWQDYIEKQDAVVALPKSSTRSPKIKKTVVQPETTKTRMNYSIPQPNLFSPTEKEQYDTRAESNRQLADTLEEKLSRFGVEGQVVKIKPGPVITLFEYEPDIDAKVSKIIALQDDMALALEAISVRIVAPIPGTSRVGFEVANRERKSVFLRDVIRSSTFQKSKAVMPIVLGKDTTGDDVVVDLGDMPHLLIAGSTGSGKSVALNTILMSLLCKLPPEQLKFIIVDPKRLEFSSYKDIPHLLFPIITQPQKAAPVLRWLVKVMEERYEMMAQFGARSIADYKELCKKQGKEDELPYIVLMIDELADLMMVARKEVEDSLARLAQMARAAGIHLIVATQRPSVDVLTGVIKVNFPSRMSFRVTSKVDSRTVLDALGAETLLGKGDMLFVDAHSSRMRRIHGAYVTDAEINTVANHVRAQQKVEYISLEDAVAAYKKSVDLADEPLLQEVIAFLQTIDDISISSLQRRFKIGYNRSARIIEMLEMQGRIMPSAGGKTRKVIK